MSDDDEPWDEAKVRWHDGARSEAEYQEMVACAACGQTTLRHGPFQRCPTGDTIYTRKPDKAKPR